MGPKKPQRQTASSAAHQKQLEAFSPHRTSRLYLETSFASLQSQSGLQSTASSITNGFFPTTSRSSPLPLTNVITLLNQRARSAEGPVNVQINITRPSRSRLSLNIRPTILDAHPPKIIDLIHDDWFGLAPLASPESLSEVSSISSRASFTTNLEKIQTLSTSYELKTPKVMRRTPKIINNLSTCADDIRNVRYFQKLGQLSRHLRRPSQNGSSVTNSSSNISFASAASSKSNDDHSIDATKCCNIKEESQQTTNTSGESDEFQSAEEVLENVMEKAGCADFFKSNVGFLETHFDFKDENPVAPKPVIYRQICAESVDTSQELDPDLISNFAIDLNLDEEHRSSQFSRMTADTSKTNSVDSGSTSRMSSEVKNVTFNPEVINIDSRAPSTPIASPKKPKRPDRWNLRLPLKSKRIKAEILPVPTRINKPEQVPKTILCSKRRNSEQDFFSRTEALPLLSGLSGANSERASPSFVRRKKYIYPITVLSKEESSV